VTTNSSNEFELFFVKILIPSSNLLNIDRLIAFNGTVYSYFKNDNTVSLKIELVIFYGA